MENLFVILGMFGAWEIIAIVAVLLVFFGGKKIPELMKGLGQGIKEFKKASKNNSDDLGADEEEKK
jgi:sec-independent protein translocase protein TatA